MVDREQQFGPGSQIEQEKPLEFVVESAQIKKESHSVNQDTIIQDLHHGVFGVLDGMGGLPRGDIASGEAGTFILAEFARLADRGIKETSDDMIKILKDASQKIVKQAKEKGLDSMGTTATIAKILNTNEGRKAIIGQIGDSRAYIKKRDGRLIQATLDQSLMTEALLKEHDGDATAVFDFQKRLSEGQLTSDEQPSPEEMATVAQYIGDEKGVNPEIYIYDLEEGDEIFLMSDGAFENLKDSEMEDMSSADEIARKAKASGRKMDDISVLKVALKSESQPQEERQDKSGMLKRMEKGLTSFMTKSEKKQELVNFLDAESGQKLLDSIIQSGGVQGSKHFFTPEEIFTALDYVLNDRSEQLRLTEQQGLREAVMTYYDELVGLRASRDMSMQEYYEKNA